VVKNKTTAYSRQPQYAIAKLKATMARIPTMTDKAFIAGSRYGVFAENERHQNHGARDGHALSV
jgi:hypothetical protein